MNRKMLPLSKASIRLRKEKMESVLDGRTGIITGCPGSGRRAIVKYLLKTELDLSKGRQVFFIDFSGLITGSPNGVIQTLLSYIDPVAIKGTYHENLASLVKYIKSQKVILFIENINALEKGASIVLSKILSILLNIPYKDESNIKLYILGSPRVLRKIPNFYSFMNIKNLKTFSLIGFNDFKCLMKSHSYKYNLRIDEQVLDFLGDNRLYLGNRGREIAFLIDSFYGQIDSKKEIQREVLTYLHEGTKEVLSSLALKQLSDLYNLYLKKQLDLENTHIFKRLGLVSSKNSIFIDDDIYSKVHKNVYKGIKGKSISLKSLLSGREQRLYNSFVKRKGEVLSKEDIAKILWGDEWVDKFSDWAISRAVNRLDEKLKKELGFSVISNVHGKGYFLNKNLKI